MKSHRVLQCQTNVRLVWGDPISDDLGFFGGGGGGGVSIYIFFLTLYPRVRHSLVDRACAYCFTSLGALAGMIKDSMGPP